MDGLDLLERCYTLLERAVADRRSPFRTFCIATSSPDGPQARFVVLRKASRSSRGVTFWTDIRSPKVDQLRVDDRLQALFWHPNLGVQLRLTGTVGITTTEDEDVSALFASLPDHAVRDYASLDAPGKAHGRSGFERERARENFAVVSLIPTTCDLLVLERERHRRFAFDLTAEEPTAVPLVP